MRFRVYKDAVGQYRWRLVASNGKIVADSGESYWNRTDCLGGIRLVASTTPGTPVDDLT